MNIETYISALKQQILKLAPPMRAALLIGTLAVAGVSGLAWMHPSQAQEVAKVVPVRLSVNDLPVTHDGKAVTSFAPIIKRGTPSVVNVLVTPTGTPRP